MNPQNHSRRNRKQATVRRNVKSMRTYSKLMDLYVQLKDISESYSKAYTQMMVGFTISFICLCTVAYMQTNAQVTYSYLDEPFHVVQAQAYCDGNFTYWNHKITTPPGLYLFSIGILRPFHHLLSSFDRNALLDGHTVCSLEWLRLSNLFFALGNLYLIYQLLQKLHSDNADPYDVRIAVNTFSLALFPPFFFFNFLYYTDTGSVFFVLITILFDLHQRTYFAASFALISLIFRQNNIIWIFMLAAHRSFNIISSTLGNNQSQQKRITSVHSHLPLLRTALIQILNQCAGYLVCGVLFLAFVVLNHGIVLGDRQAHVVVPHFAQICYFLGFTAFFSWSHVFTLDHVRALTGLKLKHLAGLLCLGGLMLIAVYRFNYVHPYLLSDNRHFAFYVWRRILNVNWAVKSGYVLVYLFCSFVIIRTTAHRGLAFQMTYLMSVVAILAPTHLFEFRYFILPYLIWRVNMFPKSITAVVMEAVFNLTINFITLYLFLYHPFEWKHVKEEQRFMW